MTKKTKAEQARHQRDSIYSQWTIRPVDQRTRNATEQFADEVWAHGPRQGSTQELHRQMVMDVIRAHIVDR